VKTHRTTTQRLTRHHRFAHTLSYILLNIKHHEISDTATYRITRKHQSSIRPNACQECTSGDAKALAPLHYTRGPILRWLGAPQFEPRLFGAVTFVTAKCDCPERVRTSCQSSLVGKTDLSRAHRWVSSNRRSSGPATGLGLDVRSSSNLTFSIPLIYSIVESADDMRAGQGAGQTYLHNFV
jgi:hypothetical protein